MPDLWLGEMLMDIRKLNWLRLLLLKTRDEIRFEYIDEFAILKLTSQLGYSLQKDYYDKELYKHADNAIQDAFDTLRVLVSDLVLADPIEEDFIVELSNAISYALNGLEVIRRDAKNEKISK